MPYSSSLAVLWLMQSQHSGEGWGGRFHYVWNFFFTSITWAYGLCWTCLSWTRSCQVLQLGAIPTLVSMMRSSNPAVSQAAAGALRNLVFKHQPNKQQVQQCGGIGKALQLLKETDSTETQKEVTGRTFFYLMYWIEASQCCATCLLFFSFLSLELKGSSGTCLLLMRWKENSSPQLCLPWLRMCWCLSPAGQTAPPPTTFTLMFSTMPLDVFGENCVHF